MIVRQSYVRQTVQNPPNHLTLNVSRIAQNLSANLIHLEAGRGYVVPKNRPRFAEPGRKADKSVFGHAHSATFSPRLQPHETSNLLQRFAQRHRLRISPDGCGDLITRGKQGDISDYGDDKRLIAAFWGQGAFSRARAGQIRKAITENYGERRAGGLGGDEATFTFDPSDDRAAQFFLTALAIKRKRKTTPAMLAHLARMRARARAKKVSPATPFQTLETIA